MKILNLKKKSYFYKAIIANKLKQFYNKNKNY